MSGEPVRPGRSDLAALFEMSGGPHANRLADKTNRRTRRHRAQGRSGEIEDRQREHEAERHTASREKTREGRAHLFAAPARASRTFTASITSSTPMSSRQRV